MTSNDAASSRVRVMLVDDHELFATGSRGLSSVTLRQK